MDLFDVVLKILERTPELALWVIAIIYGFKVVLVGSVYGVIRFTVQKLHDVMINKERKLRLDWLTIGGSEEHIIEFLSSMRNGSKYVHTCDVARAKRLMMLGKAAEAAGWKPPEDN